MVSTDPSAADAQTPASLARPSDRVVSPRVAVVGCGYWGKNLVRNFAELGALSAIADADRGLAQSMADRHDARAADWQAVLDDGEIDGVVIAAPAEQHARLTWQALEAGKHVFVEKPIALNTDDARRSMAMAEERGRILMVGHLLQYHPAFNALQTMVADRVFGRLQYIYSNRLNLGKIRREENILWSFAPHDLSMILALAGELPTAVQATGSCYMHEQIADVTTTNLTFANGINAHIFVSWLHPSKEQKLVLIGSEGMAVFDDREDWSRKLVLFPHKIDWPGGIPEPIRADGRPVPLEEAEPLRLECQHFLDCISQGQRPRTDGREALDVLRVLSAAQKSMNEGREIGLTGERPSAVSRNAFVHESAYVDAGAGIGQGTKVWHFSHILSGSDIGNGCTIGQNVMIGPDVRVGDGCKIQNNVSLYKGVQLEEGVFCGPSCVFTNVTTPRAEVERKDEFKPTLVRKGATIGANATIVCGATLGRYSFIAAGAVVRGDVPDFALMAGVPAKQIGWMSAAGERLGDDLRCPRTGDTYRETDDGRLELVGPVLGEAV